MVNKKKKVRHLIWISAVVLTLLLVPVGFRMFGDKCYREMNSDKDIKYNTNLFKKGEFFYSIAKISPLSAIGLRARKQLLQEEIFKTLRRRITLGLITLDEIQPFLTFLDSRTKSTAWKGGAIKSLVALGNYEEAISKAGKPERADYAGAAALAALSIGDKEKLLGWLSANESTWITCGNNLLLNLKMDAAIKSRQEKLAPNETTKTIQNAELARRNGNLAGALDILRPLMDSDDCDYDHCQSTFALSLKSANEKDFALLWTSLQKHKPIFGAKTWLALANAEYERGNKDSAYRALKEAMSELDYRIFRTPFFDFNHFPNFPASLLENPRRQLALNIASLTGEKQVEAKELLTKLIVTEAAISLNFLDFEKADKLLTEAEAMNIEMPQINYGKILVKEIQGKWEEAKLLAEKLFQKSPEPLQNILARHAFISGDFAAVVKLFPNYSPGSEDEFDPQLRERRNLVYYSRWLTGEAPGFKPVFANEYPDGEKNNKELFQSWLLEEIFYGLWANPDYSTLLLGFIQALPQPEKSGLFVISYRTHLRGSPITELKRNHLLFLEAKRRGNVETANLALKRIEAIRTNFLHDPFIDPDGFNSSLFVDY